MFHPSYPGILILNIWLLVELYMYHGYTTIILGLFHGYTDFFLWFFGDSTRLRNVSLVIHRILFLNIWLPRTYLKYIVTNYIRLILIVTENLDLYLWFLLYYYLIIFFLSYYIAKMQISKNITIIVTANPPITITAIRTHVT